MKYILLFIHALAIAAYQLFFGDPIAVTASAPASVNGGEEFAVEIRVNKAQVSGFAKLQVNIPAGFEAREGESKGGSFTASGTLVKIIWTSVPADPEFTVKVMLKAPAGENGDKQLTGKFSYIENNVKQEAEFSPITVKVGAGQVASSEPSSTTNNASSEPAATSSSNETTAASTDKQESFSKPGEPDASVSAERTITNAGPNTYQVSVRIKKGNIKGFAKFSDKIPADYKAEDIERSGASFETKAGEVKYIWTSIPDKEEITIIYKLVPEKKVMSGAAVISGGQFSYIESDKTKKYALGPQSLDGSANQPVATEKADVTNVATETPANINTQENAQPQTTSEPQTVTTTEPTPEPAANNNPAPVENKTAQEPATTASAKGGKVHYSVQIGAFKNSVNAGALGRKFSIGENVKTEMEDGFTKCVVGKYGEYKTARDQREGIRSKGATDAFVTAYNSGKRITVQEALMVSSQKWFR